VIALGQTKSYIINLLFLFGSIYELGRMKCDQIKRLITMPIDYIALKVAFAELELKPTVFESFLYENPTNA
jgi:hypothetical protein